MAGGPMDAEGNKAYEKQIDAKHRKERLKEFESYKPIEVSDSDFHHHGIDALRAMIAKADPDALETSGDHWRASADRLAGEDGQGGIRKAFMDAVDHASGHWRGQAADAFRREAAEVLKKIDRTYGHARNVEQMLIGTRSTGPQAGVAHNLREAKKAMSKIEDPGKLESAFNSKGDDTQFHKDMADKGMDARMALELNRDKLSLSKERQVEAVIVMEELAANYRARSGSVLDDLGPAPGGSRDWPTAPSAQTPPPPVNMPTPGGSSPKPTAPVAPGAPKAPLGPGVPRDPNGVHLKPTVPSTPHTPSAPHAPLTPSTPPIRTGLDGLQDGIANPVGPGTGPLDRPGGGPGGPPGPGPGGGSSTVTPGIPGGFPPTGRPGVPGGPGGTVRPGPGPSNGISGGRTGGPGGTGNAGAGRPGMPGGMGGGAGAGGGASRGGAGRSGAQARTRGGVVGAPGGPASSAKQGGSGLHRSRGGAQAAGAGQRAAGMPGVPGGRGGRGEDKERGAKDRPDYLIEDEETWTPRRNVSPRVIE